MYSLARVPTKFISRSDLRSRSRSTSRLCLDPTQFKFRSCLSFGQWVEFQSKHSFTKYRVTDKPFQSRTRCMKYRYTLRQAWPTIHPNESLSSPVIFWISKPTIFGLRRHFSSCSTHRICGAFGRHESMSSFIRNGKTRLSCLPILSHQHPGSDTSLDTSLILSLNSMISRNFTTTHQDLGRHKAYSVVSSRSGDFDSNVWRRNEQQHGDSHDVSNDLLWMLDNNKHDHNNTSRIDRRMTNIRKNILDHNKNIKDKIITQRHKGVKVVRRLRRKLESQKEDIRTIPNLLTTLRMASAPVLAYLVVNDYFGCALSLFVLAGITDMLDGYIARNFKNQRTALGTALDPLADKFLISFLTLSLTSAGLIPVPLTVLILSRDAGLILASFVIRYKSLSPPKTLARYFDLTHVTAKLFPSTISKINTAIQLSYVACVLASPVFEFVDHPLLQALMYTTAATTFLSGLDYVITWRRRLKIVKNK